MTSNDGVLAAASEAFAAWGRGPAEIDVLAHSENIVFRVCTADGEQFALRLHRPGYNTLDELRSEVVWIESLAASGLDVARPVATPAGDHYVDAGDGEQHRYAGLVRWVEGRPLSALLPGGPGDIERWFHQLGTIIGAIRAHATSWTPPPGFVRRRWDVDGLLGEHALWGRFWESPVLDHRRRSLFVAARDRLADVLRAVGEGPDHFGLIHADLHSDNVMAHGDRMTVIDFDDAGYGFFAYELAVALHHLLDTDHFDIARRALFAGYATVAPLTDDDIELVDVLLTVRCLIMVSWLDARPTAVEFPRRHEVAARAERAIERILS